jgi:hypothetical protein
MNQVELAAKVRHLEKAAAELAASLGAAEDIEAIKKLQCAYGYYLEHWEEEQILGLFSQSDETTVEINDFGLFKGWKEIKACYRFEDHYPEYPGLKKAPGEYLHILMPLAGIINLEPDGKTAKGRWYGFFLGAQRKHGVLRDMIACGIWENQFVKEDGVWKILKIFWNDIISSPLEEGWVKTPALLNPKHKDYHAPGPDTHFHMYPSGYIFPYHYKNPVTGK